MRCVLRISLRIWLSPSSGSTNRGPSDASIFFRCRAPSVANAATNMPLAIFRTASPTDDGDVAHIKRHLDENEAEFFGKLFGHLALNMVANRRDRE